MDSDLDFDIKEQTVDHALSRPDGYFTFHDRDGQNCCVGGAFCIWAGAYVDGFPQNHVSHFPNNTKLSNAFRQIDPNLTLQESHDAAYRVITFNDKGKFEEAKQEIRKLFGNRFDSLVHERVKKKLRDIAFAANHGDQQYACSA